MRIIIFILSLFSIQYCLGQSTENYHFEQVEMKSIDSLISDSLVINEFKIINYCYCLDYLKTEGINAENRNRKKNYRLSIPNPYSVDYAPYGGGQPFSFHTFESRKSFFRYNNIEKEDIGYIIEKYYAPIADYIKKTNDMHLLSGYSPMFECFYAVEKMPLQIELKNFLLKNRSQLKFFKVGK